MRRKAVKVRKYANEIKVRIRKDHARMLSPAEVAELQLHVARAQKGEQPRTHRLKVLQ